MSRIHAAGRGIARIAAALAAAVAVAVAFGWAPGGERAQGAGAGCGSASAAAAAAVDGLVAHDIYANELAGSEVSADLVHVASAPDLLAAVAAGDGAAVRRAVLRIVFHPHWHIVRLRVLDRSGRVLADVGGRYTIAPSGGPLRAAHRVVGRFLMSVQDDIGVAKLETRFVGDPVGMYVGGRLVAALDPRLPAAQPRGPALRLAGVDYLVVSEADRAFPDGTVTLVLLVAPPALAAQACAAVRAAEFGKVAARLARLAVDLPRHYAGFAATVTLYSGALVFVRDGGRRIASSPGAGAGPAVLPRSGTVAYEGRRWLVYSFVAAAPARIYVLAPPG